jgi:hypothetical protein
MTSERLANYRYSKRFDEKLSVFPLPACRYLRRNPVKQMAFSFETSTSKHLKMKWIEKTNLCFEAVNDVFTLAIITPEFNNDPKQISITIGKGVGHHLSLRRFEVFKLRQALVDFANNSQCVWIPFGEEKEILNHIGFNERKLNVTYLAAKNIDSTFIIRQSGPSLARIFKVGQSELDSFIELLTFVETLVNLNAAQVSESIAVVAKEGAIPETVIKALEFFSGSSMKLPQFGQSLLAPNQETIDFIQTFIKQTAFTKAHQ